MGPEEFAIVGAKVFDGERALSSADVLVRAGRIEALAARIAIPPGVRIVPGASRTLMPGLIDAHVHNFGDASRDALRFGVTTELDMFCDHRQLPDARRRRESLAAVDKADLWSAGTPATAEGGHGTHYGLAIPTLSSATDVDEWVAERIGEGSDYIKIIREDRRAYGGKPLPTLASDMAAAVVDAAHRRGRLAVVHASLREFARESLLAGADGLTHAFQDAPADREFVSVARERGLFVIATLTVIAGMAGERNGLLEDPQIGTWLSMSQRATLEARWQKTRPNLIANARETVRSLHEAGIPMLAGTDAPNPTTAHGASLHAELLELVAAGLTPEQSLAAATSRPADTFGLSDRGRIAAGKRADLVLVEGDPTRDIGVTRSIVHVWKNGRLVDRRPVRAAREPSAGRVVQTGDARLAGA